jgi:hypothetical protein
MAMALGVRILPTPKISVIIMVLAPDLDDTAVMAVLAYG